MKVSIELDGRVSTVESDDVAYWWDALGLCADALRGLGYVGVVSVEDILDAVDRLDEDALIDDPGLFDEEDSDE